MVHHGPSSLKGPRSRKRAQGRTVAEQTEMQQDAAFRADLVARIRREIAEGTYDTPEKLEIALARMIERLTNS